MHTNKLSVKHGTITYTSEPTSSCIVEAFDGVFGNRPSKNLPQGFRRDVRYTLDSNENLYAVYWTSQIHCYRKGKKAAEIYAGKGPNTAKSSSSQALLTLSFGAITDILWDHDLANNQVDPKILSSALRVNRTVTEGMWIVDHLGFGKGLLLLSDEKLVTIIPSADRTLTNCDGYASVVSNRSVARLKNPISIVRPARPALVILETDPLRVRLLDLRTWKVTTIPMTETPDTFDSELYFSLVTFPRVTRPPPSSALRPVRSHGIVQLFSRSSSQAFQLNVDTGILTENAPVDHFPPHDYIIPVTSSRYRPCFLSVLGHQLTMFQYESGQTSFVPAKNLPLSLNDACASVTGWWNSTYVRETAEVLKGQDPLIQPRLKPCKLGHFIDSIIFPGDLRIKHSLSGRRWYLHSDLLLNLHPTLRLKKLKRVIKKSLLPEDSINAFILRLFGNQPSKLGWEQMCHYWLHTCWLWNEVRLANIDPIFAAVVPQLPSDVACNILIHVWTDELIERSEDDLILQSLAAHVKKHCMTEFAALMTSEPSSEKTRLAMYVSSQQDPTIPSDDAPELQLAGLAQLEIDGTHLDFPPRPQSLLSPHRPFDFVFSLQPPNDQSFAVVADMRYMFTYWKWFKRLMSVENCRERESRSAIMPHWMTSPMLTAILECVHGTLWTQLSNEDAFALLEHRFELNLVDSEGAACSPFHGLVKVCLKICFAGIGDSNRFELLEKYALLGLDSIAEKAMDSIVESSASFDLAQALKSLSAPTLLRLQAKFLEAAQR